ncbi:hypothetical protein J3B02_004414 [Coemansia erecta]|uniref:Uncharacterized protein n=1 Tax=Coemansia asiatica TaxID=1052880 RepID=A0A9W7XQX4_9FUNG|nr:hypothetical protein LPJ64_000180 [Coemansia asiatica]KAJ2846422.1 hypothetical protein J3B02_004414 [Coemansia erecta]KAJ2880397.1 hypothetical protein FB639_002845 [Coemansia asiatica]
MSQTAGLAGFYQRAHGTKEAEAETEANIYFAAAENDGLGWEPGPGPGILDPMYTINRRNEEKNEANRDMFFKRLKTRADKEASLAIPGVGREKQESKEAILDQHGQSSTGTSAAIEPQKKPVVFNGMRFGFGMMKLATKTDSTGEKTSEKGKEIIKESSRCCDAESEKKSKKSIKDKKDKKKRKHK